MGSGFLDRGRIVEQRELGVKVGDRYESVIASKIANPHGSVTVELKDERGRTKHKETKDNFISLLWVFAARSWQRSAWASWPLNAVPTIEGVQPLGAGWPWMEFPNESVALWNDTNAEASAFEHMVQTDEQGLVGFASRNPVGSPAGKRGVVNVTDSIWTPGGEFMVYDWPTTAGNGTFQSVGYTVVRAGETLGRGIIRPSMVDRRYGYYSGNLSELFYGTDIGNFLVIGKPGLDIAGNIVMPFRNRNMSGTFGIATLPPSAYNYTPSADAFGAVEKELTPTILFANSSALRSGSYDYAYLGEYDGYYWITGYLNNASMQYGICRINKTTGAADRFVENASMNATVGSSGHQASGCILGNDLFIMNNGINPSMFRYDLTANPPTLTATILPSYVPDWPTGYVYALVTDGTDLYLHHQHQGVLKMNTSGELLARLGTLPISSYDTGSEPWSGNQIRQSGRIFDTGLLYKNHSGSTSSVRGPNSDFSSVFNSYEYRLDYNLAGYSDNIIWWNGALHSLGRMARPSTAFNVSKLFDFCVLGWNLGSRVLLSSPVEKTSGNTMKVSYEVIYPDII